MTTRMFLQTVFDPFVKRESWSILLNRVWPKSNDENCDPPTEKLDIPIDDLLHYG